MAQHFLLSPAAKTLSLAKVLRMSDDQASQAFAKLRWADTDGEPVCPECGCLEHYNLKSRPVWKCKGCGKQFSITSGTIFHSRKLSLRDILGAIAILPWVSHTRLGQQSPLRAAGPGPKNPGPPQHPTPVQREHENLPAASPKRWRASAFMWQNHQKCKSQVIFQSL